MFADVLVAAVGKRAAGIGASAIEIPVAVFVAAGLAFFLSSMFAFVVAVIFIAPPAAVAVFVFLLPFALVLVAMIVFVALRQSGGGQDAKAQKDGTREKFAHILS